MAFANSETTFENIPPTIYTDAVAGLKNKSIFLTGGTGFFGKSLLSVLSLLNDREHLNLRVTILSRDPQEFRNTWKSCGGNIVIEFIQGDISSFVFPKTTFDYVLHFATPASSELERNQPREMLRIISQGATRVLEFCAKNRDCQLLLASSGAVYGAQVPGRTHFSEDDLGTYDLAKASGYAEGKRYSEVLGNLYSQEFGFTHKIARCFAFVGPFLPYSAHFAIGNFIGNAVKGNKIVINGDGSPLRSYLYSDDLAFWLLTVLLKGQSGAPYNVGSAEAFSILQIAEKVKALINPRIEIEIKGAGGDSRAVPYVPSIKKAQDELGLGVWTNIDSAILKTAEAYAGGSINNFR